MSTKDYTSAERGGGVGDTGRMRAAILNQINSWWDQAKWEDPDKADRIHEKLNEAPEQFISPNPSTDYKEEASRVYKKIKQDYSLRSVTDLEDIAGEYEERADRHIERKKRKEGFEPEPESELGGAPDPKEPEDNNSPAPEPAEDKNEEPARRPDLPDPEDRPELVISAGSEAKPQNRTGRLETAANRIVSFALTLYTILKKFAIPTGRRALSGLETAGIWILAIIYIIVTDRTETETTQQETLQTYT